MGGDDEEIGYYCDQRSAVACVAIGPNVNDMSGRAVDYIDKILNGAKPADLPIQQPTRFEMVINAKAAKASELTFPRRSRPSTR
nr:ABC transporter substrate binding protein [uncultured bacterium]